MRISKELVIQGLKHIAENREASSQEIRSSLVKMGWNFSWRDFYRQFPFLKVFKMRLFNGIRKGRLWAGANILINLSTKESDDPWCYVLERFLDVDDDYSIYHYVRLVTGDNTYTREKVNNS